jgi:hypothetical protein
MLAAITMIYAGAWAVLYVIAPLAVAVLVWDLIARRRERGSNPPPPKIDPPRPWPHAPSSYHPPEASLPVTDDIGECPYPAHPKGFRKRVECPVCGLWGIPEEHRYVCQGPPDDED